MKRNLNREIRRARRRAKEAKAPKPKKDTVVQVDCLGVNAKTK